MSAGRIIVKASVGPGGSHRPLKALGILSWRGLGVGYEMALLKYLKGSGTYIQVPWWSPWLGEQGQLGTEESDGKWMSGPRWEE